ncbi:unnamed protein product, partial [Onchocerca ochengi]
LLALMAVYYMLYGMPYINEAFLYHLHRTDTRHNFSPYFYMLYLAANDMQLSRLISFCCFIPQALLIIWLAFRFHDDLPFCWLLTTAVFVSFNKVCTSQYFIWYICLLPIAQQNIEVCWDRAEHYCIAMLYLIGLGLGNVDDITVKGMAIVQKCSRVYLETYTSIMSFGLHKEKLEEFFGKEIEEADRATVELDFNSILNEAHDSDICLLVVGDPLGATTHADLVLTARKANINVEIVHNASIISAVGCCGLQ